MDVDTIQDGQRRLEDPDDLVHVAIAAALERDVRVIPILVAGAVMARRQDLPEGLERLARRNALSVRHVSSRSDADRLLAAIELILRSPAAAGPVAPSPARVVPEAVEATEVAAAPSVVQVLRHDNIVNGVEFSPDGRQLATTSHDDSARVWALIR